MTDAEIEQIYMRGRGDSHLKGLRDVYNAGRGHDAREEQGRRRAAEAKALRDAEDKEAAVEDPVPRDDHKKRGATKR